MRVCGLYVTCKALKVFNSWISLICSVIKSHFNRELNTGKPQKRRRMSVNTAETHPQPGNQTSHLLAEVKLLLLSVSQEKEKNE